MGPEYSAVPRPSEPPATYDTDTPHPPSPVYTPYPTGGATYPTQPPGPVYPSYSVAPQPDEPPPSYDAAVGFTPEMPQASDQEIAPET